jgi:hypothetical protein
MTNHRRQTLAQPIPARPYILIILLCAIAGAALGWSLRQIAHGRQLRESPRVHLREYPAPAPVPVREVPGGISFEL